VAAVAEKGVDGNHWGDIEELRQTLAGRATASLNRLDDVVSELFTLHSFDAEAITARVRATIEREANAHDRSSSSVS
jgi:hypothetical protein